MVLKVEEKSKERFRINHFKKFIYIYIYVMATVYAVCLVLCCICMRNGTGG